MRDLVPSANPPSLAESLPNRAEGASVTAVFLPGGRGHLCPLEMFGPDPCRPPGLGQDNRQRSLPIQDDWALIRGAGLAAMTASHLCRLKTRPWKRPLPSRDDSALIGRGCRRAQMADKAKRALAVEMIGH